MENEGFNFGQLIEEIVRKKGSDVETEAKRWGYSQNALYKIFKKEDVGTDILKKVSELYKVRIETLLGNINHTNMIGYANAMNDSTVHYNSTNTNTMRELEAKVDKLESENKLLREMVEILKSRDK